MTGVYILATSRFVLVRAGTEDPIGCLEVVSPVITSNLIKVGAQCYQIVKRVYGETELHAPRQTPLPNNGWITEPSDTEDDWCSTLHVRPYDLRTDLAEEEIHTNVGKGSDFS